MLKKLEDEFPNHGNEYNNSIDEIKKIKAIEIYSPKAELAKLT